MLNREQIIEQVKANIRYYDSHSSTVCHNEDGSINPDPTDAARVSAEILREILHQIEEYDHVFDPDKDMKASND